MRNPSSLWSYAVINKAKSSAGGGKFRALNSVNKPNSLKTTKSLRLSDFAGLVINPASLWSYAVASKANFGVKCGADAEK